MAAMYASGNGTAHMSPFSFIVTFRIMSVTLQYVVVFLAVAASVAYVVFRIRRMLEARKSGRPGCIGCPLKDACAKSQCEKPAKPRR